MNIENLLNSSNTEEGIAFLTSLIPMIYSDTPQMNNSKISTSIDLENINEKILAGPKSYIDDICVNAAEYLQSKNIFVLASVKFNDYIYLLLDKLSSENMSILKEKYKELPQNYFINFERSNYSGIRVKQAKGKKWKNIANEFVSLASGFHMQDIQRGYFNEKNFLMNVCDCEKVEGLKEFKSNDAQIVFDVNKMDKSFREYLRDSGYEQYYVQEEHRIYLNDFYLNAHNNYLETLEK